MIPVSAIIPTADRPSILQRTIEHIGLQDEQPNEIIIIDASRDEATRKICEHTYNGLKSKIVYIRATQKGAAIQRNQGIENSKEAFIFFIDDDIIPEPGVITGLWNCIRRDNKIGAVNAMITNQRYHTPGKFTRLMYRLMSGKKLDTYAGKCIGPAWNLLPEDRESLPHYNEVEWLNTTCTLYRREALPVPAFSSHFTGYSMMEDVALSLLVGRYWKLFNVRTARIFHDSQPGSHKSSVFALSKMELVNRQYIMAKVMGRTALKYYFKLFLFEAWGIFSVLNNKAGWKNLLPSVGGKFAAIGAILSAKHGR